MFVVGSRWQDSGPPYLGHCEIFLTDTLGNIIYNRTLYEDTQEPRNTEITHDDKILVMCGFYIGSSWDIYFYKLNQFLEDDTLYNIQLTYDSLCPGTISSDTMTVDCGIWVDIDEMFDIDKNKSLKIYPNPARDYIHIEIPDFILSEGSINGFSITSARQLQGELELLIYDGYGRKVNNIKIHKQGKTLDLDISSLNSGIHIAVLYQDGKLIASGKFLVQK